MGKKSKKKVTFQRTGKGEGGVVLVVAVLQDKLVPGLFKVLTHVHTHTQKHNTGQHEKSAAPHN